MGTGGKAYGADKAYVLSCNEQRIHLPSVIERQVSSPKLVCVKKRLGNSPIFWETLRGTV